MNYDFALYSPHLNNQAVLLYVDISGDIIFVPVDPIRYEEQILESRSESNSNEESRLELQQVVAMY
jgi:hypothetical protein